MRRLFVGFSTVITLVFRMSPIKTAYNWYWKLSWQSCSGYI